MYIYIYIVKKKETTHILMVKFIPTISGKTQIVYYCFANVVFLLYV